MSLFWILIGIAIAFSIYAVITKYPSTPSDQPFQKRIVAALAASAAALGAAIMHLINSGTSP